MSKKIAEAIKEIADAIKKDKKLGDKIIRKTGKMKLSELKPRKARKKKWA